MTSDDLLTALYGVAIAALGIVSAVLGVVARYAPDVIRTFLEQRKLISLERAGNIAAQAVEEKSRGASWAPGVKAQAAEAIVKSMAPIAARKADSTQIADVVKAGVQQMRASVPDPALFTPIPVTLVGSSLPPAPAAIPPPGRLPNLTHTTHTTESGSR